MSTPLRVKYTTCESCGQSGEMVGGGVVIEDCGACLQVYRAGSSDWWTCISCANGARGAD